MYLAGIILAQFSFCRMKYLRESDMAPISMAMINLPSNLAAELIGASERIMLLSVFL